MNTFALLPILAELPFPSTWEGLLLFAAVAAIVIWALIQLVRWSGIVIPRPIVIIAIALGCILAIYWLFKIFHALT